MAPASLHFPRDEVGRPIVPEVAPEWRVARVGFVLVFDGFEPMDVAWLSLLQFLPHFSLRLVDVGRLASPGAVCGTLGIAWQTTMSAQEAAEAVGESDWVIIPGGIGTRKLVQDDACLQVVGAMARKAGMVLTVCTGAGLLARTGFLDGARATSNKIAWEWVVQQSPRVQWVKHARWIVERDGRLITAAGVTAGIDAALAAVAIHYSEDLADFMALYAEHPRCKDPTHDPFGAL